MSTIPRLARAYLLVVELVVVATTIGLLLTERASGTTLSRFLVLAALSIGYGEIAVRSERIKRYLGSGKLFANPLSVWSFAAVLTMPAGWATALIAVQYGHVLWQRRRDSSGPAYRTLFTAAATMAAQLCTAALVGQGASGGPLTGSAMASLLALAGVLVFTVLNFSILAGAMWLTARPPSARVLLPDHDAVGYELATLVLGIAAAEFLLHNPLLIPVMLVLTAYVHRSSVVKALQHASRTDSKTGLLNAAAWTEHAAGLVAHHAARPVAVLIVDIDHFKTINDTHGHLVGDQVLLGLAGIFRRELRGHDACGRFGGDEFVVVLDDLGLAQAEMVGNRLRMAAADLQIAGGSISVSIGLAHTERGDQPTDVKRLLERADGALYRAKLSGRNRVCVAANGQTAAALR